MVNLYLINHNNKVIVIIANTTNRTHKSLIMTIGESCVVVCLYS